MLVVILVQPVRVDGEHYQMLFFRSKNTVHTSLTSCSELVQPCTVDARAVAVDLCGQSPH